MYKECKINLIYPGLMKPYEISYKGDNILFFIISILQGYKYTISACQFSSNEHKFALIKQDETWALLDNNEGISHLYLEFDNAIDIIAGMFI